MTDLRTRLRALPHWGRVVMDRSIERFVDDLPVARLDALEVSGSSHGHRGWQSHVTTRYPDLDLCSSESLTPRADVVFCEQVLEHVVDPGLACRNLAALVRPGGHVVVSTPFLVRIHREPADYWRFTEDGLRLLLQRAGLRIVELSSWGNAACVVANLATWIPYVPGLHSLVNQPDLPFVVWAIGTRDRDA